MNLKQKIALGLCAFYLISVIGVALSLHFCGGHLSAVHFTEVAKCKGCVAAKKEKTENNCCKNTTVDAKIKDSHESCAKVSVPKKHSVTLFFAPYFSKLIRILLPKFFSKVAHGAPPLSTRVSLYAFHCVFRN